MELLYKNCKIAFTVTGKGSAVVLLHGFLENQQMWNTSVAVLAKKHKVITIDLLGHGKSENLSYIHTMEEQANMVKAVLSSLRLRRCFLIGHSMGGYVALAFAKQFPHNIKGVLLMNSTALPDSNEKRQNRDRAIKLIKQNKSTFIKTAIPMLFSEENRAIYKTEIKKITQQALQTSTQGIIAALEGMKLRKDLSEIHKTTLFPVHIIIGRQDPALNYQSLLSEIENTNTKAVEFADGHMSHIENESDLIKAFSRFLVY